jgi:hypothetical protein
LRADNFTVTFRSATVASSPIPNLELTPIPVPGLVGGILGALVFAALLSLAALLLIRRRRRRSARPALTGMSPSILTLFLHERMDQN